LLFIYCKYYLGMRKSYHSVLIQLDWPVFDSFFSHSVIFGLLNVSSCVVTLLTFVNSEFSVCFVLGICLIITQIYHTHNLS